MNRGRVNCCDYEEEIETKPEKKEHKCKPHHQTETILRCGTATGSGPLSCNGIGIPSVGSNGYGFQPIVQAAVVLNTSKLINPTVKIDFSSLISFKTCGDDNYFLHLAFKLSKVCGGGRIPLGTWTFEQSHHEDNAVASTNGGEFVQETDPFCFSWCECDDCPDCCRYIIEIVDQQCYNIEFVTVSNISLTALAVGLKNSHRD
ncbi:MAG: DUF4489 domain-containing protein [Syntrophomonas sp.]|nr:DUF4489 domain-containing protein [Syntrophomonas sp.]